MFESLRDAFRQAVRNFQTELNRDRVPEAADRLLAAMKRELVDARARTHELRAERDRVFQGAQREEAEARTCLRREEMARGIGDEETARIAHEYAGRHLRTHDVLSRKAEALDLELTERERELRDMEKRFRKARLERESLAATAGRTDARDRIDRAGDLLGEIDRMEERIRDMEGRTDAVREMQEALDPAGDSGTATTAGGGADEDELDRRLGELKARMERERPGGS